jgi:hypothetical protein
MAKILGITQWLNEIPLITKRGKICPACGLMKNQK